MAAGCCVPGRNGGGNKAGGAKGGGLNGATGVGKMDEGDTGGGVNPAGMGCCIASAGVVGLELPGNWPLGN